MRKDKLTYKRRDSKGRILQNGESQHKDGRYRYTYVDSFGKSKCLYSWRLVDTDDVPEGKKKDVSLRDKIRLLEQAKDTMAVEYASQLTVRELVKKYILQKGGVRQSTRAGYKTVMNLLEKDAFGGRSISEIKVSDAKEWLIKLQQVDGRGYSSIHTIRGVVRPAFQMATNDDLIVKNPFEFPLAGILVNDSVRREAITRDQKRKFLEFIKKDKHFSRYYEGIYILFYTGLRISEFVGLTTKDIDLEHKKIDVNHQLQRGSDMQYLIQATKTNAGTRVIPISDDVCECFRKILKKRKLPENETGIIGENGKVYKEFLYYDKNRMPMVALHWEKYFQHIVEKYNRIYKNELPKITPHVCRHTYCSHMASTGMNPKYLQYLMGHSEISVTLDVYTHVEWENIEKEVHSVMANCRNEAW
jgi:site-specific recombinase XerD